MMVQKAVTGGQPKESKRAFRAVWWLPVRLAEIDPNSKVCPYCGFQKESVKPTIERLVQERVGQGWRISERHETDVVMEKGEKIPHVMHIS